VSVLIRASEKTPFFVGMKISERNCEWGIAHRSAHEDEEMKGGGVWKAVAVP